MLLSAVSVLVVMQSSSEIPEGLMNNPVLLNLASEPRNNYWNFKTIANLWVQNLKRDLMKKKVY